MSADRRFTRTSTSTDGSRTARIRAPEFLALALLAGLALSPETASREPLTPQQQRLEQWQNLSPEQREAVRLQRERFLALPPGERAQLEERHRRFQALPPAQQREIREAWRASRRLTPEENRALRDCMRRKADGERVACEPAPPAAEPAEPGRTRDPDPVVPPPRLPR
jgi:hypothetical protein